MNRRLAFVPTAFLALLTMTAVAQDTDLRSYRLGSIASWSEAISVGIKELAFSSPATPREMDELISEAEQVAARFGVSVYRETDLLVTDLFPADVAEGKHVLLLYREPTLDKYLALKKKKSELVAAGDYAGKAREDIARGLGRLLSYPDAVIDDKLRVNGVKLFARPTFDGVWTSPGVILDDPRWTVQDSACRNSCSLVAYHYLGDLLTDPANDDTSVVDLYADTREFNRHHVANLTRPATQEAWASYDYANDAALDCTPEGDGLQHQITAPPPFEIQHAGDRVLLRYEYWNAERTVYMDGRRLPHDLEPSRLGFSLGRYEGDTLVVSTYALIPSQISLADSKFYLSDKARFVERYELKNDGDRLEIQWSVIDPVNLREPYIGMMTWVKAPGWELDEWVCEAITGEF